MNWSNVLLIIACHKWYLPFSVDNELFVLYYFENLNIFLNNLFWVWMTVWPLQFFCFYSSISSTWDYVSAPRGKSPIFFVLSTESMFASTAWFPTIPRSVLKEGLNNHSTNLGVRSFQWKCLIFTVHYPVILSVAKGLGLQFALRNLQHRTSPGRVLTTDLLPWVVFEVITWFTLATTELDWNKILGSQTFGKFNWLIFGKGLKTNLRVVLVSDPTWLTTALRQHMLEDKFIWGELHHSI